MWATLALLGGMLFAQAVPAAGDDLALQVRRLVRQLDAPQLAEREAAEARLAELGPKILDLLPKGPEGISAEVAQRVGRIRQKLQRQLAESTGQPSLVSLQGAMPAVKALAAIQEQTGNKLVLRIPGVRPDDPTAGPTIQVDLDNTPFWQALDQVLDRSGLGVYAYGEEKAVCIVPRGEGHSPRAARASYSGPFRFEPVSIQAVRDLRNPQNESLRLALEVAWEPRLAPVSLLQRMADVRAVDENGKPLAVDDQQAVSEVNLIPGSVATTLEIPLRLPPRDVRHIARLTGTLTVLLPGEVAAFRFSDLEKAERVEKRVAGVTVMLERVRKNRAVWEARMLVRFDQASGALESHRNWIYDNEVYLELPDGKPVAWATFETTRQTESEVGVAYYFAVDGPLAGYTLVYKTPSLILSTGFDYQLRDIPLP